MLYHSSSQNCKSGGPLLTPVIPATQKSEIRKMMAPSLPKQIVRKTLSRKKKKKKKHKLQIKTTMKYNATCTRMAKTKKT
jgi:hypothetical protein